jgi:hypothetical protein
MTRPLKKPKSSTINDSYSIRSTTRKELDKMIAEGKLIKLL